ncbi:MAG TPA: phosphate ABC transporter permease PstA [Rhodoblastus sp.]|nr:phosphate ABC transporter permease PstA [Rhodoblastus sp.]
MALLDPASSAAAVAAPNMNRSFFERRALTNFLLTVGLWSLAALAAIPLFSVLYMLISRGGARISLETLTSLPPAGFMPGGGIGNAIVGTLVMVAIGALISVPFGVLGGVFLGIVAPNSKIAATARFVGQVLTGFPSILAGVFVYGFLVLAMGTYSALAGGLALAVGMFPMILLTTEQAVRMVPQRMKDAAVGMGCTPFQATWKVTLPTALPGVMTGVMLSIAGAAGNSAPLLFTALFSNFWLESLREPTASLAILIYNFSGMPFPNQIELAWAASLVLVLIVLVFNIFSRMFGSPKL